jgi:hypothetical protein
METKPLVKAAVAAVEERCKDTPYKNGLGARRALASAYLKGMKGTLHASGGDGSEDKKAAMVDELLVDIEIATLFAKLRGGTHLPHHLPGLEQLTCARREGVFRALLSHVLSATGRGYMIMGEGHGGFEKGAYWDEGVPTYTDTQDKPSTAAANCAYLESQSVVLLWLACGETIFESETH